MSAPIPALTSTYASAELLTCGLIRTRAAHGAPDWGVSAFSVLTFLGRQPPSPLPSLKYLTPRPENVPGGNHRLFITVSQLTAAEGLALAQPSDRYKDPRSPPGPPIESLGTWVGAEFVGNEEHPARSCIAVAPPYWLVECWRAKPAALLEDELGEDAADWLRRRIRALTGIALNTRRERLGNFLVVYPERRHRMRVWWPTKGRMGVEVRSNAPGLTSFRIVVRAERDDHVVAAENRDANAGFHVFNVPDAVTHRSVELFDASTGDLIDRDAGVPMRQIWTVGQIAAVPYDLTIQFKSGAPTVRSKGWWGTTMKTLVGEAYEWEARLLAARDRERKEALRKNGRLLVYRGAHGERDRAIADIRGLLGGSIDEYVKIWDPYFSGREAALFLPSVFDMATDIQVLTSLEAPPFTRERLPRISADADVIDRLYLAARRRGREIAARFGLVPPPPPPPSPREQRKQELKKVLDLLRRPTPSMGFARLQCKVGRENFHDRFIITKDRCWQLGCSLNQIGGVMSTIVDFPYPSLIEAEFDRAFGNAGEAV